MQAAGMLRVSHGLCQHATLFSISLEHSGCVVSLVSAHQAEVQTLCYMC